MDNNRVRRVAAATAIGIALLATLGEASKESTNNASGGQSSTTAAPAAKSSDDAGATTTAAPASSAASPIPIGTTTTVAEGWDLTVNSANLNADSLLAAANQFATPETGTHFVMVNVTVVNNSTKPEAPFTNIKASVLPTSGVAVDTSFTCGAFAPDKLDVSAQMQPGATATGNLCYEVKEADIPGSVLLGEPLFTMDELEDQRFFAIQ